MRTTIAALIIAALFLECASPAPVSTRTPTKRTPAPTATTMPRTEVPTATPTSTRSPTNTPEPTSTPTPTHTPTLRPTPTPTLSAEETQIYGGIPIEAINRTGTGGRCGGTGIVTQDHDPREGAWLDFWGSHPGIPQPVGFTHRSRDGRVSPDYCTDVGFPISFLQTQGEVESARPDDGVMTVLTTEGDGAGLLLVFGHVDMDVDRDTPGMQHLPVGSAVSQGDVIAYTGRAGLRPEVDAATNFGIIIPGVGYHPDQEMMLIGPDGQPNIQY